MTSVRPNKTTAAGHLSGSATSWHGKISIDGPFALEADRYHLYIGLFCPFAHRANLARHLKGLQDLIPISIVKPYPKGDERGWPGWQFPKSNDEYPRRPSTTSSAARTSMKSTSKRTRSTRA